MGAQMATVIRNDLQNSGLFRSIAPGSFIEQNLNASAAAALSGLAQRRRDRPGGRLGRQCRRQHQGRLPPVGRDRGRAGDRPQLHQPAQQLAAAVAHHRRRDLQARDRRGGLLRHPRRLCRRRPGRSTTASSASRSWTRTAPTTATSPTAPPSPSRRASRRPCRRSSTWRYGENKGPPRVYLQNVDSGRRELMGNFPGMSFAPRFSPDGSQGRDEPVTGWSHQSLRDGRARPQPAPADQLAGDRHLAVLLQRRHADRLQLRPRRHPAALRHAAGGGGERRISFGEGRYATPVWSPRGDYIAFTKIMGSGFGIGIMRPDGSGERLLANGFLVEGPTWAPNGRVLMFFRQQPNAGGRAGSVPQRHRRDRALRASGSDAHRRVGSGLVTLDSAVAKNMIRAHDPSVTMRSGRVRLGVCSKTGTTRGARCESDA